MSGLRAAREFERSDGALPTVAEALELAGQEYAYRRSEFGGYMLLSRGADGGMHYRDGAGSRADAERWVSEHVRALAQDVASGAVLGSLLFWDGARRRWYLG